MELHEIRYFLALSKTLNFTKAAEACNVSQPALTRAIQKMEDELGGLLFSRERNNTHLTELGRLIEPHLTEVLARTQAGEGDRHALSAAGQCAASLGVMCTIAPVQFVSFLGRFRAAHPGVDVTLLEHVPDRLCELLVRGNWTWRCWPARTDLPLRSDDGALSERFVIACSAGHRFATQTLVGWPSSTAQPYLARINCEYNDVLDDVCRANGSA